MVATARVLSFCVRRASVCHLLCRRGPTLAVWRGPLFVVGRAGNRYRRVLLLCLQRFRVIFMTGDMEMKGEGLRRGNAVNLESKVMSDSVTYAQRFVPVAAWPRFVQS